MPEHTEPEKPIVEAPEEKKPAKDEEEDVDELMEKYIEKMYKSIGELTEAVKALATHLKSVEDTQRGLIESVKGEIESLKGEVKKLSAGFSEATAAHKEQDKYPITGKPKASETGEEVTYPPKDLRERGAEMLEKSRSEFVKSVTTPRPAGIANEGVRKDGVSELVKGILYGGVKPGEIPQKVREVFGA
jgi:hypothetical protein